MSNLLKLTLAVMFLLPGVLLADDEQPNVVLMLADNQWTSYGLKSAKESVWSRQGLTTTPDGTSISFSFSGY